MTIVWADNAIQNKWLQVTVLATSHTGLSSADVFYFGNAIGESGNFTDDAVVDSRDESLALANKSGFSAAPITDSYDYNRDGRVTVADVLMARRNHTDDAGGNPLQIVYRAGRRRSACCPKCFATGNATDGGCIFD